MNAKGLILIGGGGHGRVVLDTALAAGLNIVGIADPALTRGSEVFGIAVLGGDEVLEQEWAGWLNGLGANPSLALRRKIFEQVAARGIAAPPLVHPAAIVSRHASVAEGVQVMAGGIVQPGTKVGRNAVINTGARIDHYCLIGNHAFVSPGATVCGEVQVGEGAFIGAGSTVLPGCAIGPGAVVGAGAIVTHDIVPDSTVAGNPARTIKRNA